ncbi:hypothetical protein [Amycolatopsis sp. NPDC102389]
MARRPGRRIADFDAVGCSVAKAIALAAAAGSIPSSAWPDSAVRT